MSAGRPPTEPTRALEKLVPTLPLAWLGAVFLLPLAVTVVYAFAHSSFARVELGFTLDNFKEAWSGFYVDVFIRTMRFAATGTVLVLAVAIPVAYTCSRKAGRFKMALLVLLLVPFWTSFLVRVLAWRTLLDQGGLIEQALNALHLHSGNLQWLDSPTAVFIGIVYAYMPLAVIPLFVAFDRIPDSAIEASKDLGAGRWRTFKNVTLPMAKPGLVAAVLLTFVPMTGEFVIPALLGGAKGALYGSTLHSVYLSSADYPLGSAMAVSLLVVVGVVVAAIGFISRDRKEVLA
jgi:spermidine/putrescine transport system permease protein